MLIAKKQHQEHFFKPPHIMAITSPTRQQIKEKLRQSLLKLVQSQETDMILEKILINKYQKEIRQLESRIEDCNSKITRAKQKIKETQEEIDALKSEKE